MNYLLGVHVFVMCFDKIKNVFSSNQSCIINRGENGCTILGADSVLSEIGDPVMQVALKMFNRKLRNTQLKITCTFYRRSLHIFIFVKHIQCTR